MDGNFSEHLDKKLKMYADSYHAMNMSHQRKAVKEVYEQYLKGGDASDAGNLTKSKKSSCSDSHSVSSNSQSDSFKTSLTGSSNMSNKGKPTKLLNTKFPTLDALMQDPRADCVIMY